MYIQFDELGNGKGGTQVKIGQVDRAERGIVRHDRVEQDVHGGDGCDVGEGRAGGRETISACSAANTAVDTCEERAKGAGLKEGGRRPLLLGDRIVVGRSRGGKVDGAESAGSGNELNKLVVTALEPLRAVGAGKSGLEGERKTGGIKV
jgi:hypothetical protein